MSGLPVAEGLVSVAEYLATEPFTFRKREYLAGVVCEMPGASHDHNVIAMNLYGSLHASLRGKTCQPFGSDMRLRLRRAAGEYFYYPDAMISCDPADAPGEGWKERPAALFEILSRSTRGTDNREKRMAYLEIPSLRAYVRIEQARPRVTMDWRQNEGEEWRQTSFRGLGAFTTLPTLKLELPLAELYERLDFTT